MVLESLLELVETLRERIRRHRSALNGNEMLTRYALVDPLLRELGWDTSDPTIVVPEDTSGLGRGRPDYVLRANGQPTIVIEAKKLGSGLQSGARQAVDYAMDASRQAPYFSITDGRNWETYDTNRPANDMRVSSFDIMASSPADVCLKAMALWRPAVEHGSVIAAETPIIGLDALERDTAEQVEPQNQECEPTPQDQPAIQQPPAVVAHFDHNSKGWIPLSQYVGKHREKPDRIIFPDGSVKELNRLNELLLEPVRWLHSNGYLNESDCPIRQSSQATNYVVASQEADITSTRKQYAKRVGPFWVDTGYNAIQTVNCVKAIITQVNQDPADFKVCFSP